MAPPRPRSGNRARWLVPAVLVVAALLIWVWRSTGDDEAADDGDRGGDRTATARPRPPLAPARVPSLAAPGDDRGAAPDDAAPPPRTARPYDPPPGSFNAATDHTADPCTATRDPVVPAEYAVFVDHGVTVAWSVDVPSPYQAPIRPAVVAGALRGLIDEAAAATGTSARAELTIVIDASRDEYTRRTGAPSWSGGYWDGGEIRTFAEALADLGVDGRTLRHEVMHAQIHAAVGCVPIWLHEGVAQLFDGSAPVGDLLAMVRDRTAPEPARLGGSTLRGVTETDAAVGRAYAMALAMVFYAVPRGHADRLAELVATARSLRDDPAAVWDRIAPGVGVTGVIDALAVRTFGAEADATAALVAGPVCCSGIYDGANLRCRAPTTAPPAKNRGWIETTPAPPVACRATWF